MAKAKAKTTTITAWEKMASNDPVTVQYGDTEIEVTPTIPYDDAARIINFVSSIVLDEETGDYHPEVMDALFKEQILEYYAHFNRPKSFDKIYNLVYTTDAYDLVVAHTNRRQVTEIESAIYDVIEYKKNVLASGIQAELQKTMAVFDSFNEKAGDMFSQVDDVDMGNLVKNVASMSGSLDEEKLVRAVREAQKDG